MPTFLTEALRGPKGFWVVGAIVLGALILAAVIRRSGKRTYTRMPLHWLVICLSTMIVMPLVASAGSRPMTREEAGVWTAFAVLPAIAFLWGLWRYPYQDAHAGDVLKRGAAVADGDQAKRESRRLKKKHGKELLTLAGLAVPPDDEPKHFKLIGTTGSGKSTAIRELMHQALQRGDRAVFADPDGGYLSRFYDEARGDVILNPFDGRSVRWNPLLDVEQPYDADLLAKALIPGESEWNSYARTFVTAVIRHCKATPGAGAAELWRLIAVAPTDELREILQGTAAQPFLDPDNGRMFGSLRSVASNAVAGLEYVNMQRGPHPDFSVRAWIQKGQGVLFMPYQAEQISALKSLIATWMRLAIFQTMSLPEKDNRLWFVVDELDALGHIDGLKDALARMRKFGGRCVLGFQSIAQVSTTYGPGPAKTIVENCSNTLILRSSTSEGGGTAEFASSLIGKREVIRPTVTHSTEPGFISSRYRGSSHGEQHTIEDAVLPSEIETLPDRAGFAKFASIEAWQFVRFEYFEPPKVSRVA